MRWLQLTKISFNNLYQAKNDMFNIFKNIHPFVLLFFLKAMMEKMNRQEVRIEELEFKVTCDQPISDLTINESENFILHLNFKMVIFLK